MAIEPPFELVVVARLGIEIALGEQGGPEAGVVDRFGAGPPGREHQQETGEQPHVGGVSFHRMSQGSAGAWLRLDCLRIYAGST